MAVQKWRKLGLVFSPSGENAWMLTHASVPIAERITGDLFKIYFSTRNQFNESAVGFVIINIKNPTTVIGVSQEPVLSKGGVGSFDDSGCMATSLLEYQKQKYLYYIGWNLGVTVPFRNSIGLAVSIDGNKFLKKFQGPIIDRNIDEPYFVASCSVLFDEGYFKVWYLSCTSWEIIGDEKIHHYHIKYAESLDGINWNRTGKIAIDYFNQYEYAISVPRVIKEDGKYKMWFSSRGDEFSSTYRIRYAESLDGKNWVRENNLPVLDVSEQGWDSEMVEYPYIFKHNNQKYMLYNGNGYGRTGFGIAILEGSHKLDTI